MFANDHCTGKLNYVKLIRESIWFAMIDSRIDSVRNILIRCTPSIVCLGVGKFYIVFDPRRYSGTLNILRMAQFIGDKQ